MSRLTDCLEGYNSIAVTGMCKNAGKTTVVNHLIECYKDEFKVGLISIGYDGEEKDEITNLIKPRISVFPGMLVATCEDCLKNSTAGYVLVTATGIQTVLGEVLLVKVISPGIIEVSGPSTVSGIRDICRGMSDAGCQKVIADGSAGRISFATVCDCTILSAGAALAPNITKVANLAHYQIKFLRLNICKRQFEIVFTNDEPYIELESDDGIYYIFRGALVDKDLTHIMRQLRGVKKTVAVNDAASLFISPGVYRKFMHKKGDLRVRSSINPVAMTINPMTPYGKWFDKDKFMTQMQDGLDLPVINVMDE